MLNIVLLAFFLISCLSERGNLHQKARRARAQRRVRPRVRSRVRPRANVRRAGRSVRSVRPRRRMQTALDASCCDCTNTESTPGCTPNPACEEIVCPLDSYCCNNYWDGICANGANNICNAKDYWSWGSTDTAEASSFYEDSYDSFNTGTTGSCCECTEVGNGPGCNAVCDNEVCPLDSYCCDNTWDGICANGANNICQGYEYWNQGGTSTYIDSSYNEEPENVPGSCCDCQDSKTTPFCNTECDAEICPLDSYCCNVQWDWICANSAKDVCAADEANANQEGGDGCCGCTTSKSTANCNAVCDSEICPLDPYCCNNKWDGICANSANQICQGQQEFDSENPTEPLDGSCCDCTNEQDTPNCNGQCDSEICSFDPYCCNVKWDWICANSATEVCENNADYEYEEVDCQCLVNSCYQELTTCAEDCECVVATEKIGEECITENGNESKNCFETILIEDVEQNKINELCNGDELCIKSISSLGQCFLNNGCLDECIGGNNGDGSQLAKSTKAASTTIKNKKLKSLNKRKELKLAREKRLKA